VDLKEYARNFHSREKTGHGDDVAGAKSKDFVTSPVQPRETPPKKEPPTPAYVPRTVKGYVYYAWDGNGRIKIGFSANPWSRVKEMRCANPSIEVLITERSDDGYELELKRHEEFKEYHLALEWFRLGERLLDHVNALRIGAGKGSSVSNQPYELTKAGKQEKKT